MPSYDASGNFIVDEATCDGRFRRKLHARQVCKSVKLIPFWKPGPVVPPPGTFAPPKLCSVDSGADPDSDFTSDTDEDLDVEIGGGLEYGIESVDRRQIVSKQVQYLVRWAGFSQCTWETRETFDTEWEVNFNSPYMGRSCVIARFDELDEAASGANKSRKKRKRKQN
jgi:hypothetical protein